MQEQNKCNTVNISKSLKLQRNYLATQYLKMLGFPRKRVLQAIITLNYITHAQLGDIIGIGRSSISQHLQGHRANKSIQEDIAIALNIPKEILFDETEENTTD